MEIQLNESDSKYKVGQLVRIKPKSELKENDWLYVFPQMYEYCGQEHRIRYLTTGLDSRKTYYRLEDCRSEDYNGDGYFMYLEEWLDPVDKNKIEIDEESILSMLVFKDD